VNPVQAAVVIPTYNERENLQPLTEALAALAVVSHVIVVDDASPDGTGELAETLARGQPKLRVLHRAGKLGLGTAYVAGFRAAFALGAERVLTMDADFSHDPRYLPDLVAGTAERDLMIGSRYVAGGGTYRWGIGRRLLSRVANFVATTALGLHARDCTAGFRCYRRELLERVDLDTIRSNGYSFLVEMLFRCERAGCRVGETPIIFANRERGVSKISRDEIVKAMLTVARLSFERLRRTRAGAGGTTSG
jgi:glycosyltransferase involved in cell wall biosynthesis